MRRDDEFVPWDSGSSRLGDVLSLSFDGDHGGEDIWQAEESNSGRWAQNYLLPLPQSDRTPPTPFNSETVISWFLLRPGPARIEVFALTGQRVAVLHQGPKKAGVHRVYWNGRDDRGRSLASGVYLYRLVTGESTKTRKLTLLR